MQVEVKVQDLKIGTAVIVPHIRGVLTVKDVIAMHIPELLEQQYLVKFNETDRSMQLNEDSVMVLLDIKES